MMTLTTYDEIKTKRLPEAMVAYKVVRKNVREHMDFDICRAFIWARALPLDAAPVITCVKEPVYSPLFKFTGVPEVSVGVGGGWAIPDTAQLLGIWQDFSHHPCYLPGVHAFPDANDAFYMQNAMRWTHTLPSEQAVVKVYLRGPIAAGGQAVGMERSERLLPCVVYREMRIVEEVSMYWHGKAPYAVMNVTPFTMPAAKDEAAESELVAVPEETKEEEEEAVLV